MSKLYIIPTPIGNLEDITFRAIRLLKEADLVLAEDTRISKKLFSHYNIKTDLYSYHTYNEHKVLSKYLSRLKSGACIALISDAGTPTISDPGFLIVRECLNEGIGVECLPGATALIPALVNSGLPSQTFIFEGFIPVKKGRIKRLNILKEEQRTMIFYESPHRILKTLTNFADFFGPDRRVSISREITKVFEETLRGSIGDLLLHFANTKPKGEFVIIVEGRR